MNNLTILDVLKSTSGKLLHGNSGDRIAGVSTDSRSIKQGEIFFALSGDNYDGNEFVKQAISKGAAGAVISDESKAGYSPLNGFSKCVFVRVPNTLKALGDFAKFYRHTIKTEFIAVTGSNGKTTTKDMAYHILKNFKNVSRSQKSFNNYIGVPLTIFETNPSHDYCVVEMGTNAPGEIRRLSEIISPEFAILTNISHTHLEGLGSIEGVANAKAEFIENMDENGTIITNADDVWCAKIAGRFNGNVISFGFNEDAMVKATKIKRKDLGFTFLVNDRVTVDLPVLGRHNVYNALAAIAVCNVIGVSLDDISAKLIDFKPPPMRMNKQVCGDITVINDQYNSNPMSMAAALEEFSQLTTRGRKVLICGDMLELGDDSERFHKEIGEKIAGSNIDVLWTVGINSRFVAEGAIDNGMPGENIISLNTSEDVCPLVASRLKSKDTVLIKGSRGMKFERVSRQIEDCYSDKKNIK